MLFNTTLKILKTHCQTMVYQILCRIFTPATSWHFLLRFIASWSQDGSWHLQIQSSFQNGGISYKNKVDSVDRDSAVINERKCLQEASDFLWSSIGRNCMVWPNLSWWELGKQTFFKVEQENCDWLGHCHHRAGNTCCLEKKKWY